ncbi:helix-turn-helix domain-containing protein [Streptomyces aidingensis]|uniref:Helix-turn-helix n=1 Tax=Streptomyces aidingensis TaxID=910347 RepID=A0A1I1TNN2_9ACTN|nr:helix-turn-helix transcriptional regulator [Streptomyces aidingensis]SFD58788.1 Helix-turn-helix [Streptomyces aidingensis]
MEVNTNGTRLPTPKETLRTTLRCLREARGLSQEALAKAIGYPQSYIQRVEAGKQNPSDALAAKLDEFFGTGKLFRDLQRMHRSGLMKAFTLDFLEQEPKALRVQVFTSGMIPGILQMEKYAREVLRCTLPDLSPEEIEDLVDMRMQRKVALEQDDPPRYWAIMDEAALRRPVGTAEEMVRQLSYVIDTVARKPRLTLQVLPFSSGVHPMMGGTLLLHTNREGKTAAVVESFRTGEPMESPEKVAEFVQLFDVACSKSLPEDESLDLVRQYAKEYKNAAE